MKIIKHKYICGILILATTLVFSGCSNENENDDAIAVINQKNQEKVESKSYSEEEVDKSSSTSARELEFKASYERSPYYNSNKEYPIITIVKSKKDLKEHEAKVKGLTVSKLSYVKENSEADLNKYNDEFFTNKALIVITLDESSGSVRHNVKNVVKDGNNITIAIERKVPEFGTSDMAEWNIYIELNAEDVDKNDVVNLRFNDGLN
ncbi:MAG: hypothetical protein ACLSV2_10835 [Clostridium sp.]